MPSIKGNERDNELNGTSRNDRIDGRGGDDILRGFAGRDNIKGGRGDDFLDGGTGDDKLYGQDGNDALIGGAGRDRLHGGKDDDILDGGTGDDRLYGDSGNDTIFGGAGNDRLYGDGSGSGSGGRGATFDDYLDGGVGNDFVQGGRGSDTVLGGAGNDIVIGDDIGGSGSGDIWKSSKQGGGSGSGSGGGRGRGSGSGSGSGRGRGSGSGSGDAFGFADYLDGGAGNDIVLGGGGDDAARYGLTENVGASDRYAGGRGNDTLILDMTRADWFRPEVQADVAGFLAFVAANTSARTGEANSKEFRFTAFDLTVREFEELRIFVDGVELTPQDDPVTAVDDSATVNEDDAATAFPSVLANDDVPDLAYSVRLVSGPAEGVLVFNAGVDGSPDGSYSFDPAGDFEDLPVGATRDVTFVYEVTDADGDTSQATVTITVTGSNDAPVITSDAAAAAGAVAESGADAEGVIVDGGTPSATGTLTSSDVDTGAAATWSGDATGTYGAIAIDPATGVWTYTLDNGDADTDALAAGQVVTESFVMTVTDDQGAVARETVTVSVTGANDLPVSEADESRQNADIAHSGNVLANDTDVDATDTLSVAEIRAASGATAPAGTPLAGRFGTLSLGADGGYTYLADETNPDVFRLPLGDTVSETFLYTLADSAGGTTTESLTVTIVGINTTPEAADDSASVAEGGAALTGDVGLNDVDPDRGAVLTFDFGDALPAGFSGQSDGTWTFDPTHPVYDGLAQGETVLLSLPYAVSDEKGAQDTATLRITVTGTNDAPIAVADASAASVDTPHAGQVLDNDTDRDITDTLRIVSVRNSDGAAAAAGQALAGLYGTLTLSESGIYSYAADATNPTVQALPEGVALEETFTYTVSDPFGGTDTATLTLTILGQNDAPIAGNVTRDVSEGDVLSASVAAAASDVDTGATLSFDFDSGPEGFVGRSDGSFTVDASGAAYNALAAGSVTVLTVGYTVSDAFGLQDTATLTLNLRGENDAPTAGDVVLDTLSEDAATVLVAPVFSDVDAGDILSLSVDETGLQGALTVQPDGTILYTSPGFDALSAGETVTETFTYTVTDTSGAQDTGDVRLVFVGENDAPTAGAFAATLSAGAFKATDEAPLATFLMPIGDVDANDTLTVSFSGGTGTLTPYDNGFVGYDLGTDYSGLAAGETITDTFTYTVSDGTETATNTATITIVGVNDAPVAADDAAAGATATVLGGNVIANDSDPDDARATLTVARVSALDASGATTQTVNAGRALEGQFGTLILATDGGYSYQPGTDAAVTRLPLGETLTDSFVYQLRDPGGETSRATLEITLTGTYTVPVAADDTATATEGAGILAGSIATNDSDADSAETLTYTQTSAPVAGFALASDGSWTFDQNDPAYDGLAVGETLELVIAAEVSNTKGASDTSTLTLTLTGTNDGPVAEDISLKVWSAALQVVGTAAFTDVDDTEGFTYEIDTTDTTGTVINNGNGTFAFLPGSDFAALGPGEGVDTTFTYTVRDASGAASTGTVTVTVTYDAPPEASDLRFARDPVFGPSDLQGIYGVTGDTFSGARDIETALYDTDGNVIPGTSVTLQGFDNAFVTGMQVADFDRDGDDDILVSWTATNFFGTKPDILSYHENLGMDPADGSHRGFSVTSLQTGENLANGEVLDNALLRLLDVNDDGFLDLLPGGWGRTTGVIFGSAEGFDLSQPDVQQVDLVTSPSGQSALEVFNGASNLVQEDVNQDGILDLVAWDYFGEGSSFISYRLTDFSVAYGLPGGGYQLTPTDISEFRSEVPFLRGNFDGIGAEDFLSVETTSGSFFVDEYTVEGFIISVEPSGPSTIAAQGLGYDFDVPTNRVFQLGSQKPFAPIIAVDVDGDGTDEIIVVNSEARGDAFSSSTPVAQLELYDVTKSDTGFVIDFMGTLTAPFELLSASDASEVQGDLIDVNGDGLQDIVVYQGSVEEGVFATLSTSVAFATGAVSAEGLPEYTDLTPFTGTTSAARLKPVFGYDIIEQEIADEDTPFTRTLGVRDPDNVPTDLTYTLVRGPEAGSVTFDGAGNFTFDAMGALDHLGEGEVTEITFDFQVSSSPVAVSNVATVLLEVRGVNDAPEVQDLTFGTAHEDAGFSGTFAGSDIDNGDSIARYETRSALTDADGVVWGTVSISGDRFSIEFEQGLERYETRDLSFDYVAIDSFGAVSDTGTVALTLEGEWEPVFRSADLSFATENAAGGTIIDPTIPFLGVTWDEAFDVQLFDDFTVSGGALDAVIGGLNDVIGFFGGPSLPSSITIPGVDIYGSTSGTVGLQPSFSANTGFMDNAAMDISLEVGLPPQLRPGEEFTGYTGYTVNGQNMLLQPADVSFGLDLIIDLALEAGIKVANTASEIVDFDVSGVVDLLDDSPTLFDLSIPDAPGFTQSDYEVDVSAASNLQSFTASSTGSEFVSVSNEQPLVYANLDIDSLLGWVIPKFQTDFSVGYGASVTILGETFDLLSVNLGVDLLDLDLSTARTALNQTLSVIENYRLDLNEVPIVVSASDENGDVFFTENLLAGDSFTFNTPNDVTGNVSFDAQVDVEAVLDHVTTLGADIDLLFGVLALGARVSSDFFGTQEYNVFDDGNPLTGNQDGFDYFFTQPVDLFETNNLATLLDIQDEDVDGFNTETAVFDVVSDTEIVPELWIV